MAVASTPRGRHRLASAVLVILILVSIQKVPPIDLSFIRSDTSKTLSINCLDCCGPNCQCSGDCCGDSHVVTVSSDGFRLTASERVSRDRNCQKSSWLLPTVNTTFQPWSDAPRKNRHTPTQAHFRTSIEVVCRWQRPAISQSNPRGPPLSATPSSIF